MQDRRRIVGGMLLITVMGLALIVPPVVHLFNHDASVLGIPQIVVYLFGVWIALIAGTAALNARLSREPQDDPDSGR